MKKNCTALVKRIGRIIGLSALGFMFVASSVGTVSAKNKKFGVFVGINDYPGMNNDLSGAVNDARNLRKLLTIRFRFLPSNTTLLLDKSATRANIIAKIKEYGQLAGNGDILVFHYSGHGSLFLDSESDELDERTKVEVDADIGNGQRYVLPLDFYDSALVPWDSGLDTSGKPWGNLILDDELYGLFSPITKKGVTVVFISDSCHSGSISKAQTKGSKIRFMAPEQALNIKSLSDIKRRNIEGQIKVESRNLNGSYLALAAAKDNEFAMDSSGGASPGGLFTATLIQIIKSSRAPLTYKRLMEMVRSKVSEVSSNAFSNDQHPQLEIRFGSAESKIFEPIIRMK